MPAVLLLDVSASGVASVVSLLRTKIPVCASPCAENLPAPIATLLSIAANELRQRAMASFALASDN